MSQHEIVWELNGGSLASSAVCNDDDCLNRYVCTMQCELVHDVRRDDWGVTHGLYDWEGEVKPHTRHKMEKVDYCNIVEFLEADPYVIPELQETEERFEIGRTAILPVWQGEDGLLWKRA